MYAVVRTGGKQYKVAVNDLIRVETLPGEQGDAVALQDVLLVDGEEGVKVGSAVAGSRVDGIIVRQMRDKKILVFKKQRRKNYRRRQGHRQNLTELKITGIHIEGSAA
ncbi:50S ribosomal protein L21 [Candidatus Magnetaquicoccus inordinatus]|uniref:50S ribosomal protein L21 n=1 Tax=Candidatus Magnetaquicoccus inordinatus TaxID=2496818 RepID=UPI00102B88D6|nr:50S ribosomal protein L21 [Candidatus Magnetaquicoccus inordinatus]